MPIKKGAGGRMQNYDPHTGRYSKTLNPLDILKGCKQSLTKEEKEKQRMEYLINCAKNKNDKYVLDALLYIEQHLPKSVLGVNCKRLDPNINRTREIDIITKHFIIEVKGGNVERGMKQFNAQKNFATSIKKDYVVFAPMIAKIRKFDYNKKGINVVTTLQELVKCLKEKE